MNPNLDPYRSPETPSEDHVPYKIDSLEIGDILNQAVQLCKNHFGLFLGITAVLLIPMHIVMITANFFIPSPDAFVPPPDPQLMQAALTTLVMSLPLSLLYFFIIAPITKGALIHTIASKYLGAPITIGQAFKNVLVRALPIIGTSAILHLTIFAGACLCCLPGVIAYFLFALSIPVVVVEHISGFGAMQRSMALTKGNYVTLLALAALTIAVRLSIGFGINSIPSLYAQAPLQLVFFTATFIFETAMFVVFYFSARCKNENFNLDILAASVVESPTADKPAF